MCRWPLSLCSLWPWPLHCWLPQAGFAHMYHTGLVHMVSYPYRLWVTLHLTVCSCTAQNSDLNSSGRPRAHAHSEQLHTTMDLRTLWDDYGIVADVEVSCIGILDMFDNNSPSFSAVYYSFSSCGYTWVDCTRSSSSINQRNIQGPSCYLGQWIFRAELLQAASLGDCSWDWSLVCLSHWDINHLLTEQSLLAKQACCCATISWTTPIPRRLRIQAVDGGRFKSIDEGE